MIEHKFALIDRFKMVGLEETRGGFQAYVRERNKLGPLGYGFAPTVHEAVTQATASLTKRLRAMPAPEPVQPVPSALAGLKLDLSRLHGVKK